MIRNSALVYLQVTEISGSLVIPAEGEIEQVYVLVWGDLHQDTSFDVIGWISRAEAQRIGYPIFASGAKYLIVGDVDDLHDIRELLKPSGSSTDHGI